jgi:hypothetical protein
MSIIWITLNGDDCPTIPNEYTYQHPHIGEPFDLDLIGLKMYVRLPEDIGGTPHRVVNAGVAKCPKCTAETVTYELDNDLYVSACPNHEQPYMFYRIRGDKQCD